ncbi:protein SERAC1 [Danaus plexippus]|nr:protein SERAC1 [Danaus plexippus]
MFQDRLKYMLNVLKKASIVSGGVFIIFYHLKETNKRIGNIINTNVLDVEKKFTAEYIYIDDPSYEAAMKTQRDKKSFNALGFSRIWKTLKHSLAWRLLWLCRHGNKEQRNVALDQLAAFKNNKIWDCLKIAQALDKNTAVLLARTFACDLRYFLPPPIHIRKAANTSELLSYKLRDMISHVQALNPHSCIQYFLSKYFLNIQDQMIEVDSVPAKPDNINEKQLCILCLDALHHHLFLFHDSTSDENSSVAALKELGIFPKLAELMLRYRNDSEIDFAVLKLLTVLSVYPSLLKDFYENGLIGELARLIKSRDIRLASSSAVCLANLSGEYHYKPGLYLLHPLYRTKSNHNCDILLVHGLRGGVFVTWRQRDKKCAEPVGIIEVTVSDVECDPCEKDNLSKTYFDPELQQVLEDLKELDDEALLTNLEVVLHDIPISAKREPSSTKQYTSNKKRLALIQEDEDKCNYTHCWPKDWLPQDCDSLRILGFNYWSKLSEWLEGCPLKNADIESRAEELGSVLIDAEVGKKSIVWLAHSMGGLIVKKLLVDAAQKSEPRFGNLCQKTKAVLFYSTPHKGSALATMPRAAAAILWPSQDVKQLQENSPVLLKMHNEFIKFADLFNWETISFAETQPTLVTAFKVPVHFVESFSADLGRGVFYELPLDHLSICKPATRQSILYTTVLDVLLRVSSCEVQLKHTDSHILRLIYTFWSLVKSKFGLLKTNLEDNQGNGNQHWIEKTLLHAFTDDVIT